MPRLLAASESVIRHRGAVRDEDGKFSSESQPVTLTAIAVAPGGGSDRTGQFREGEDIACTVYFAPGVDIVNGDELTVRGQRFQVVVNDWQISSSPTGGVEVRCVRGQG